MKRLSKIIGACIVIIMLQSFVITPNSQAAFFKMLIDKIPINIVKSSSETVTTDGEDMSKNFDRSVIAKISADKKTLTISGTGDMRDFNGYSGDSWKYLYKDKITTVVIEQGVTSIGERAFSTMANLTSITIPSSVKVIGNCAFESDNKLTSISLKEGLTKIENSAFRSCTGLTSITIPSSVTSIDNYAFYQCSGLKSVNIKHGLTTIGEWSFNYCTNITSIIIPGSVKTIGKGAFCRDNKLTSITIPSSVTTIVEDFTLNTDSSLTVKCKSGSKAETTVKNLIAKQVAGTTFKLSLDNTVPSVTGPTYSTTAATKDKVTVTIVGNEALQGLNGWTLSSDRKTLTKNYTANATESITVKDLVGNEKKVTVKITNIDKTAPIITGPNYSTTEPTKENVKVTIVANEEIQSVTGWTLSQDKKTLEKTYTENAEEEVIVKDLVGNENKVTVKITNIDKTAPSITGPNYSTTEPTKENVKVTIVANEEIQSVTGWTLSQDKKTLEKTYTENTEEEVIVKDLVGNEAKITVKISWIVSFKIEKYSLENNSIKNINPNESAEDFIKNIKCNVEYTIKEDGKVVDLTSTIKTGQVLTVGETSYTIIVNGDVNSDGKADIQDILEINKHRLKKKQLVDCYFEAGDVTKDGKVDIKDILLINKFRLGKIKEL